MYVVVTVETLVVVENNEMCIIIADCRLVQYLFKSTHSAIERLFTRVPSRLTINQFSQVGERPSRK